MKHTVFTFVLLTLLSFNSYSQSSSEQDSSSFYSMSLEELMNVKITVASLMPVASRESPGIVTVITADEMKRTGAQDLMQVLQQVPGFDFGVDVEGVVGIGVRGNWAHEGKALLLWDGIEMNEDLYSTLQFVHHYPIDRIQKIEIIRGPGSARYGGCAEYAVINVITYNNSSFNGVSASLSNSWMSKSFGSSNASLALGKSFGEAHINVSANVTEANQSQEKYTDFKGNSYSLLNQSGINNSDYRLDFFYRGLSVIGMHNNYSVEHRDGYDEICKRLYTVGFASSNISAKYEYQTGGGLILIPGINIKFQQPWKYKDPVINDNFTPFHTTVERKDYYLNSLYNINESINLEGGIEYYNQIGRDLLDSSYFSNGTQKFTIDNYSFYFQSTVKTNIFDIVLGSRYNANPYYPASFVPRFGITRVREKYHFKVLYSKAFRSPSIENINAGINIKPENTSVIEFETGCKVFSRGYLTMNVFHIQTDNPIVYGYDANLNEYYFNDSRTGSNGIEIDYKIKFAGFYCSANYSYNRLLDVNDANHSAYAVPGKYNHALAFPSHEICFNANYSFTHKVNFNFTQSFLSERYSASNNEFGVYTVTNYPSSIYSNAALNFENILAKGLDFQISCLNIFNEKTFYIQPYNGNHEPLPGASREIQVRLSFTF